MPNMGRVIQEEIRRLSRKEVRAAVGPMQKRLAEVRRLAAELKKTVGFLEAATSRLTAESDARQLKAARTPEGKIEAARLGARSIRSQRKRFGFTREEFGRLVGVSPNTVYLWESGKVAPRGKRRSALLGLRKIGAREAKRLLSGIKRPSHGGAGEGGRKK